MAWASRGGAAGRSAGSGWPISTESAFWAWAWARRSRAISAFAALPGLHQARRDVGELAHRLQRLLGERALLVEGALAEVLRYHLGDQRQVGRPLRLLGRQVLLERRRLEAAHAAPEVDLVAADADADAVGRARVVLGAAPLDAGAGAHRRQQRAALDAVLRLHQLDVEGGDPEVAVVGQREADQPLQARIGEDLAPAAVGGGRAGAGGVGELGGDRRRRSLVFRGERAGRQAEGDRRRAGEGGREELTHGDLPRTRRARTLAAAAR
jgi:hypothetical protein